MLLLRRIFSLLVRRTFLTWKIYLLGFYCDFDRSQCEFVQRKDDTFDWIRKKGPTPSGGTGPQSDVSGTGISTAALIDVCLFLRVKFTLLKLRQILSSKYY